MTNGYRLVGSTGIHMGDRAYQQDQVQLLAHPRAHGCVLGILADGMGGRSGGRKAADQVMLTAQQLFERYSPDGDLAELLLHQLIMEAHMVIRLVAIASEQEPHSTVAAFLINPLGDCYFAHVGDSRLYHFRNGALLHRSKDHSYVQALVDRKEITEAQAHTHPQSNILLGSLGTETDPPIGAHRVGKVQPGDVLVACSDGLWHYLREAELGDVVQRMVPGDAVRALINTARGRAHGSGDNLSVIVIKIEPPVETSRPKKSPLGRRSVLREPTRSSA
jgi:serine/threonine protein phosphatase PrpC